MNGFEPKRFQKRVLLSLLAGFVILFWLWMYLKKPGLIRFYPTEHPLHLLGMFFFILLLLRAKDVITCPVMTTGFGLTILGFWSLFLERMMPLRAFPSGMSLHLLFFVAGAVILMFSILGYLCKREHWQEELQHTKNLLSFILQYIPDHVYIKDRQSRFVDASMSLARHFGLTKKEELLGKTDFDFFTNPHAEEAFFDEQRIIESGIPIVGKEEEETWSDGRKNWVLTSKIPWKDEAGKVIGIIGISQDITPLVSQRKALEEKERFLSAIFENIQDGLCVIARDMTIVRVNRLLEEAYPEERPLAGKKCYQVFHRRKEPCENCPTLKVFATGKSHVEVRPYERAGEQVGWLEVIAHPLQDEHGAIQGTIEQIRNITRRIQDEEELKTREENFRLLAESNPSAILIYQDNRYVYANPQAERITGYSREELIGMPITHFVHPDFVSMVAERAERRQKNLPVEKQYEIKILTKDGKERWLFLSGETILYGGRWAGLVSAMDITEKKSTERKTFRLNVVLECIRNVNQILSRENELAVLLEKVSREMVKNGTYVFSLIYLFNQENPHLFHAGIEQERLAAWMEFLEHYRFSSTGQSLAMVSPHFLPPEQTALIAPIRYQERLLGMLAVGVPAEFAEDQEEQALLLELSDDLAFGMYNLELQKVQQTIQKNLEESERRLRNLLENLPLGVTIFQNGQFTYTNPFADLLMDRFADALRNLLKKKLDSPTTDSSWRKLFTIEDEVPLQSQDGEEKWFFIRGRPTHQKPEEGLILFLLDITEKKKSEAVVEYLASYDSLTGLYNRGFFEEILRKTDQVENLPISIIMGDLNGLKLVNDAFGHEEGDRLLRQAASLLRQTVPPESVVARFGGDEFIILLPRTDHAKTQEIVERIYNGFLNQSIGPIPVSISLGFGTKNTISQNIADIVRIAENWMYQRKLTDGLSYRVKTFHFLQKTLRDVAYEVEEHSQRMKKWALQMAEILNLPQGERAILSLLADFHDIGKIAIPQSILQKPGPLSEEEWKIVHRHPETGFRVAQAIPELAAIAPLILAHHEWYSGQGYPRRLQGEEIPLLSRVIAICDAFDVMVSGRPYKKARSLKEAITELRRCSGTQFDPQLVEMFIQILDSPDS